MNNYRQKQEIYLSPIQLNEAENVAIDTILNTINSYRKMSMDHPYYTLSAEIVSGFFTGGIVSAAANASVFALDIYEIISNDYKEPTFKNSELNRYLNLIFDAIGIIPGLKGSLRFSKKAIFTNKVARTEY